MSVAVWYFLRTRPGDLRPLPQTKVDAFFTRGGVLPSDDGIVRYVELVVRLENRRAIEVVRFTGHQHRALASGAIDRAHHQEVMALVGEAVFGRVLAPDPPRPVIDAGHRFAQRRLDHTSKWELTKIDVEVLRTLVNRRAGHPIM